MRAPAWMTVRRNRKPAPVEVAAPPDALAGLADAARAMGMIDTAGMAAAMEHFVAALRRTGYVAAELNHVLAAPARPIFGASETSDPRKQWLANHLAARHHRLEVARAGLEAKFYVQGGLSPEWATPDARDRRVRAIMAGRDTPKEDLARLAAAFLKGWATHRPIHRDEVLPCTTGCQYAMDVGVPFGGPCTFHDDYADHLGARDDVANLYHPVTVVERWVDGWLDPFPHYKRRYMLGIDQDPDEWLF
jgi:hypothetical protein